MTQILVTGATGYVGSHVVAALHARGASVTAICRDEAGAETAKASGCDVRIAALDDAAALSTFAGEVNGVAHMAASEDPTFQALSRGAIQALVQGMSSDAAFVTHSGSLVFGPTGRRPHPGEPPFAPPPALASKASTDQFVIDLGASGVRTHVVYGAMVFGGGAGAMIPSAMIRAAKKAGYSAQPGDGTAIWSATHVEDWADLIVRVLLDGRTSGRTVIAAGQEITTGQLARAVAKATTGMLSVERIDEITARSLWGELSKALFEDQYFDGMRARHDYGWDPPLRDFEADIVGTQARP